MSMYEYHFINGATDGYAPAERAYPQSINSTPDKDTRGLGRTSLSLSKWFSFHFMSLHFVLILSFKTEQSHMKLT